MEDLTTFISWLAIDQRGPSALYFASDSRISWGVQRRWDSGRKLFGCKRSADIFGYVGEVVFPSLVLGQIIEAADCGLLFRLDETADIRHQKFVEAVQSSFTYRRNAPNLDFEIIHGTRARDGLTAEFKAWELVYSATANTWSERAIEFPADHSRITIALGSGRSLVEMHNKRLAVDAQGRTSRAVFWAFCDALKGKTDPLSGGPPQLVGLYRTGAPLPFGIIYQRERYFQGLPLDPPVVPNTVEWRDENFQRMDGETLNLIAGAQRHGRHSR